MLSVMIGLVAVLLASTAWGQGELVLPNETNDQQFAEIVKKFPNAESLWIVNTKVTDAGLVHLEKLQKLNVLSIRSAQITDAGLVHLKKLPNLKILILQHHLYPDFPTTTDTGLAHLKGLINLKGLDLGGIGVTDAGMEHLKELTKLKSLDLADTQVTDVGLAHLKGLTNLKRLYLHNTQVTDAGLIHLKGLTKLEWLSLSYTSITDAGLVHLKGLTKLEELYLSHTKVTGAGLEFLKELTSMKSLSLNDTPVSDVGLAHLKGLSNLKWLEIKKTKISPSGIQNLRKILHCEIRYSYSQEDVEEHALTKTLVMEIVKALNKYYLDNGRKFPQNLKSLEERSKSTGKPYMETLPKDAWGNNFLYERLYKGRNFKLTSYGSDGLYGDLGFGADIKASKTGVEQDKQYYSREDLEEHALVMQARTLSDEVLALLQRLKPGDYHHKRQCLNVTSLELRYAKITDEDLIHLGELVNLEDLDLAFNPISDVGLLHLKGLKNLEYLSISSPHVTEAGLRKLRVALPNLSVQYADLDIPENCTDQQLDELIRGQTQLTKIHLMDTKITDAGLVHLKEFTRLKSLQFVNAEQVTDAGLVHLKGLTNLEELYLWNTKVTDAGLVHLKGLTKLKMLWLRGNKVTDAGVQELQKALPNCEIQR
ncbi:MAG: leucine-rich repeat domain-containing protein [Planctomycetota bacterium]|nr:leucine-rich repeat domain-containing protein [Planctomycetota bacterium]